MQNDLFLEIKENVNYINSIDNEEVREILKCILAVSLSFAFLKVLSRYFNEKS